MSRTPDEYAELLNDAVQKTRDTILDELSQSQADANTCLSAKEAAAHDKWTAYKLYGRERDVRKVFGEIEERAARAKLMSANLAIFGEAANEAAEATIEAMASTAAAVKQAVAGMEVLTDVVHGLTAITEANDRTDDINLQGRSARKAVEAAMTKADVLKNDSLNASIQAAMPLAGVAAQTLSLMASQMETVAGDALSSLTAARNSTKASADTRNSTWTRFYGKIVPFENAMLAAAGLQQSVKEIDRTANYGLTVKMADRSATNGAAALQVRASFHRTDEAAYLPPQFFAVKKRNANAFHYDASTPPKGLVSGTPVQKSQSENHLKEYEATPIVTDAEGDPIAFGSAYCVFALRTVSQPSPTGQQSGQAAGKSSGKSAILATPLPKLTEISLPSAPFTAHFTFREGSAPLVSAPLPGGAFMVAFRAEPGDAPNLEYRLMVVPEELWLARKRDDRFLASQANPADYIVLTANPVTQPAEVDQATKEMMDQYNRELSSLSSLLGATVKLTSNDPTVVKAWQACEDPFKKKIKQWVADAGDNARIAYAYFSPVEPPPEDGGQPRGSTGKGQTTKPSFVFGYYNDMCGDFIDFTRDSYVAGVLAAPKGSASGDTAQRVLSPVSIHFGKVVVHGEAQERSDDSSDPATPTHPAQS